MIQWMLAIWSLVLLTFVNPDLTYGSSWFTAEALKDFDAAVKDREPVVDMAGSNGWFFACIQISQEAGQVVWYSHLFKSFPQIAVNHTVKGLSVVSETGRCFSRIPLLSLWSNGCWQFDLWFLCLFSSQLEHLEVHRSCTVEAWLGEFWALPCYYVRWVQMCGSWVIL